MKKYTETEVTIPVKFTLYKYENQDEKFDHDVILANDLKNFMDYRYSNTGSTGFVKDESGISMEDALAIVKKAFEGAATKTVE